MLEILKFACSGFWTFCGVFAIVFGIVGSIAHIVSRLVRCRMVLKHGWPPNHLDADGDSIKL